MLRFLKSAGIVAAAAVLLTGCSKSSNPAGPNGQPPQLTAPTFGGPNVSSSGADTSSVALSVNDLATTFNAVAAGYTKIFQQAGSPKQSGSTWTWSISTSAYSMTFTATQSDTTYNWTSVVNGTYQGIAYDNWTAFEGSETVSGANGNWTLFNSNATTPLSKVTWSTDGSGNRTGTIISYDSTGVQVGKYVFTNNKDNSGELEEYTTGTTPVLKVTWTGNGSGAWWKYDDKGNVIASGTWS